MTELYEETECTRKEGIRHYFDKHFVKTLLQFFLTYNVQKGSNLM